MKKKSVSLKKILESKCVFALNNYVWNLLENCRTIISQKKENVIYLFIYSIFSIFISSFFFFFVSFRRCSYEAGRKLLKRKGKERTDNWKLIAKNDWNYLIAFLGTAGTHISSSLCFLQHGLRMTTVTGWKSIAMSIFFEYREYISNKNLGGLPNSLLERIRAPYLCEKRFDRSTNDRNWTFF